MTERRWRLVLAAAGMAIVALSFVPGWIGHERELRGEGYRWVETMLSAWRGRGMPVLTIGALLALATVLAVAVTLRRPRLVPAWLLLVAAVAVLAVVVSAAVPVSQEGHASTVRLTMGPLAPVGAALAGLMVVAGVAIARPSRSALVAVLAGGVLLSGVATGSRWLGLQWAEGTGEHWADGSYTREATDGRPAARLTIANGRFAIADRWAGTWESSGWTIVLDDDPACPGSRGTYHAHGENEADLRFVKVVDTCEDGARADALEAGLWVREP